MNPQPLIHESNVLIPRTTTTTTFVVYFSKNQLSILISSRANRERGRTEIWAWNARNKSWQKAKNGIPSQEEEKTTWRVLICHFRLPLTAPQWLIMKSEENSALNYTSGNAERNYILFGVNLIICCSEAWDYFLVLCSEEIQILLYGGTWWLRTTCNPRSLWQRNN